MKQRISWDTSVKHYIRLGLYENIPNNLKSQLPRSNIHRWKHESKDKYLGCDLTDFVNKDIELYKRIGKTSHLRNMNLAYITLLDALHYILDYKKGLKTIVKAQKKLIINTIEQVKNVVGISNALRVFNISRTTYHNYKSILIHKCDASYFNWCTKRFPNQLLPREVQAIKNYMSHPSYMFWSKSSIYLKAIRNNHLRCSMSTFYKYCRLLGYNNKVRYRKSDNYSPYKSNRPNELWCADVTIFKNGRWKTALYSFLDGPLLKNDTRLSHCTT